ncbi:TPA: hypothetical protein ACHTFF_002345 [Clostridioides difficile]|uniref:Putative phage protein (Modular protein) n=5 Tax=Clostridioides difficile TaxID=1496 RepID=A0A069B2H2_CLODI|nr:hypothetical protein [Clostridioides difficile]AXU79245.1 hypothetical protein CDIF29688_01899 [Clostridioides difficile]EGT3760488.1 hypothetical protein [Clostridioides difficile]EGT3769038.1 hypothetical protein [Clostridioides difficile]EGT4111160.1 hypothetical protein [Clostridioides difficile]EGT4517224.1 hypothetical protein [Clostridioides difficile]
MTNKEKIKGFMLADLCQDESNKRREKDTYYAGKNHTFNYDLYPVITKDINRAKVYRTKKEAKRELETLNKKCIHNYFEIVSFKKYIKNMSNKEMLEFISMKENKAYKKYSKEICNICKSIKFNCESLYCEEAYSDWLKENAWGKKRGDKND